MSDLVVYAERLKLARLLHTHPDELDHLHDQHPDELREFREALSDALFDRYRRTFEALAKLSSLLPLAANAKLSEKVLGAVLSARVAGELPVQRAIDLAGKLPVWFLAEISLHLEPKRAAPVIAGLPAERVIAVAHVLLEREEYVTMGRFVDSLHPEVLEATTEAVESEEALLRIAFFADDPERLSTVARLLDQARREGVIAATAEHDLWPQALSLMAQMEPDLRLAFGDIVLAQEEATLAAAVDAIAEYEQWPLLVEILANQHPDAQQTLAEFGAQRPDHEHPRLLAAADEAGLREHLAPYERAYENAVK